MEYLLHFLGKLQSFTSEMQNDILKRFICAFTHRSIIIGERPICSSEQIVVLIFSWEMLFAKDFQRLRNGTLSCTIEFFQSLLQVIEEHHRQIKEERDYRELVEEVSRATEN